MAKKHEDFKLLKDTSLLKSRVFEIHRELWRGPAGPFQRDTVKHPGAVAILAVDAKDRVLLIRQYRPAVRRWLLEIPAGTLEPGERPLECAQRELIEETGFAARKWASLGAVFTCPGFCTELIHLFKARDLRTAYAPPDEDEFIEVVPMSRAAIKRAVKTGLIRDGKTLSALLCDMTLHPGR